MAGKLKMAFQCVAVVASLITLAALNRDGETPSWLQWLLFSFAWLAVGSTLYSGAGYVLEAIRLLRPEKVSD